MTKKISNNKGFTLVEVIISLSILIIVISIAYMVLNGANKLASSQKSTSDIQQGMNLATRYLTKDLETSSAFTYNNLKYESGALKIINNAVPYIFEINNEIEYKVTIIQKGDIYSYSLNRKYGSSTINIISNQPIAYKNQSIPIPIQIIQNDNLFNVTVNYLYKKNEIKSYKFNVYKRLD